MLLLAGGQVTPQPHAKDRLVAGTAPGDVRGSGCGKHVPGAATGVPAVDAGPEAYCMAHPDALRLLGALRPGGPQRLLLSAEATAGLSATAR
jgi:hypothetical protein